MVALFFLFVILTQYTKLGDKLFALGHVFWSKDIKEKDSSSNKALLLTIKLLSQENKDLQALLGREGVSEPSVVGRVLVRPHDKSPYDTLILDVGSRQGVKKDDIVIASQKTIIGKVAEVFSNESKILLLSSAGIATPVSIGEKNIVNEAKGRGGGNYEIILPREIEATKDSLVVYAGNPAYILGGVEVIQENETDNFKKILFTVPVALGQISYVDVLISKTE